MERYYCLDKGNEGKSGQELKKYEWENSSKDSYDKNVHGSWCFRTFIQMIDYSYEEETIFELYNSIKGKSKEKRFWNMVNLKRNNKENSEQDNKEDSGQDNKKDEENETSKASSKHSVCYEVEESELIEMKVSIFKKKITNESPQYHILPLLKEKTDTPLGAIIKEMIYKEKEFLFLDICQGIYYSLRYDREKAEMVSINNLGGDMEDRWKKFKKKAIDQRNRTETDVKQTVDKDILQNSTGNVKLSSMGVKVPLDTIINRDNQKDNKIGKFGIDVVKFFLSDTDEGDKRKSNMTMLDLFSKGIGPSTYQSFYRYSILDRLNKFSQYGNSKSIINQFLLEQCVSTDICDNICVFLSELINMESIKEIEILDLLREFVKELRKCNPIYFELAILDEIKKLMKAQENGFIENDIEKLKEAIEVVKILVIEVNNIYRIYCNCFFHKLIERYKNKEAIQTDLENEIRSQKKACKIKLINDSYEILTQKTSNQTNQQMTDKLYPYVQEAMMKLRD